MARQVRIEYPGATYHLMARGNHGQPVFADEADRRLWLRTLEEACEKTGWRIHAYVLMGNHFHLLAETPEPNLVTGMKWLQGTYTQRYNARHAVFGHLFQGRYKALVVDGEKGDYFGVVSTYIHLNPARAGLLKAELGGLGQFPWSSYPAYFQARSRRPGWLRTERVLGNWGFQPDELEGYAAYMEGRVLELEGESGRAAQEAQWKRIRRGWYLGDDGFRGRLRRLVQASLKQGTADSYLGAAKRDHGEGEAERWLSLGMKALGVTAAELAAGPRKMPAKLALAEWLRQHTTIGRGWVAERLRMGHESAVSKASRLVANGDRIKLRQLSTP